MGKMTSSSPVKRCLKLGSYNYLGFAVNGGADKVVYNTLSDYGVAACSPRTEVGTTKLHVELEQCVSTITTSICDIVFAKALTT